MIISAPESVSPRLVRTAELQVECIDDLDGLAALRPQWTELLRDSAADGPFLTWEWLHAWWTHMGRGAALQVIAVRAGHELIAIAPFMVRRGVLPCFSRLECLGTGYAGSDYLDVIVRRGREAEAIDAFARFSRRQAVALHLDHLAATSPVVDLAARLSSEKWSTTIVPGGVCPFIDLRGHGWESYVATLRPSHRANVRRQLKVLEQRFRVRFEAVASESERVRALAALVGFHDARWRGRGGSTPFLTPTLRAFQDEATRRALEQGWLRLYVLHLDDAPLAVMYGFLYNRRFYFYQHGFDDRFRRYSPGVVLIALTIRAALDEGAHEFDMLWGVEAYKWLWARDSRPLQRVSLFPPHLAGRIQQCAADTRRGVRWLVRRAKQRQPTGQGRGSADNGHNTASPGLAPGEPCAP